MSMSNKILNYFYGEKNINICEAIKAEVDAHQSILEKNGFKVKRSKRLVHYEAVQCLTAEKGNVVLIANHFLRGGKDLSILLKHRGYKTIVPLFPSKLIETLAVVNATRHMR